KMDMPKGAVGQAAGAAISGFLSKEVALPERIKVDVRVGGTYEKPKILSVGGEAADAKNQVKDQLKNELDAKKEELKDQAKQQLDAAKEQGKELLDTKKEEAQKELDRQKEEAARKLEEEKKEAARKLEEEKKKAQEDLKNKFKLPGRP
ncbi:MAG: hypothetical protein KF690_12495, partial [Bacteroidetes bacterium]|nr:hypothetical protein [Bacteroidota bacterium]